MVPLDAVIQYGHHYVFSCVAPLPSPHDVHVRLAVVDIIVTVLERRRQEVSGREGEERGEGRGG